MKSIERRSELTKAQMELSRHKRMAFPSFFFRVRSLVRYTETIEIPSTHTDSTTLYDYSKRMKTEAKNQSNLSTPPSPCSSRLTVLSKPS